MDEQELIKRYGLNLAELKGDQLKLAKSIITRDSCDFSLISRFGAVESIVVQNQIISVIIVCDNKFNILEQQYFVDKLKFPYLNEFRSYRELPSLMMAFDKLSEKPDLVFIRGHGITHPRLGIASHFSIITGVPTIGVAENLFEIDKINSENILKDGKIVGRVLQSKKNANPLYISAGNGISLDTAFNLAKSFINPPHKLPEPLQLAHKYVRSVKKELAL